MIHFNIYVLTETVKTPVLMIAQCKQIMGFSVFILTGFVVVAFFFISSFEEKKPGANQPYRHLHLGTAVP